MSQNISFISSFFLSLYPDHTPVSTVFIHSFIHSLCLSVPMIYLSVSPCVIHSFIYSRSLSVSLNDKTLLSHHVLFVYSVFLWLFFFSFFRQCCLIFLLTFYFDGWCHHNSLLVFLFLFYGRTDWIRPDIDVRSVWQRSIPFLMARYETVI